MKSIELHIAQIEESPHALWWTITHNGQKTSGMFEVETSDDIARFTACAAHVFNSIKTFKENEKPKITLDRRPLDYDPPSHLDDWMKE
jgi:hypothetical protein